MDATDEQNQGTERSPKLIINHFPDEVLLEIFDSYRQGTDPYHLWRKNQGWLILAHVCKNWRAIVFASSSRLDLCITVRPEKPGHIKTILSGHLPIFIDYECMYEDITGSALWRLRAALRHHDRVRKIVFGGMNFWFDEFFKATNCSFPVLDSLDLQFINDKHPKIPDTFLRGPGLSELHLRRLELYHVRVLSISRFLMSATALTNLSLTIDATLSPSQEMNPLFACLQGMPCLCSFSLTIPSHPFDSQSHWQPSTPKDSIIPLPNLTRFGYEGRRIFLDALVAGISAPSLRDVDIRSVDDIRLPIVNLPRFLNEIKERYHTVHVTFEQRHFRLSLLAQSEYVGHRGSRFNFYSVWCSPESLIGINNAFSTRLTAAEELRVTIDKMAEYILRFSSWPRFYEQFPNVKVFRTGGETNYCVARTLFQDHGGTDHRTFLPALEEIDLGKNSLTSDSGRRSQLETFRPFSSEREQAGGCPVKVFFSP